MSEKSGEAVLLEGVLGELEGLEVIEETVLRIAGTNGTLMIDLTEDELRDMLFKKKGARAPPVTVRTSGLTLLAVSTVRAVMYALHVATELAPTMSGSKDSNRFSNPFQSSFSALQSIISISVSGIFFSRYDAS